MNDDVDFWRSLAERREHQAKAALQLAKEWEQIADERQELLEQMLTLVATKNAIVTALPTRGEA